LLERGKDSALALHRILQEGRYEVASLLTTCNADFQRVSMHGVRVELLERQAEALGFPLEKVFVPASSSNEEYEQKMSACLLAHKARGVTGVVFGDIFLEDLKRWREENLARVGLRGVFPLWKQDTGALIREFIALGFGSVICCTSDAYLDDKARSSSPRCPPMWTRAGRTASSIHLPSPGRCLNNRCGSEWAKKFTGPWNRRTPARCRPRPARPRPRGRQKDSGFAICTLRKIEMWPPTTGKNMNDSGSQPSRD